MFTIGNDKRKLKSPIIASKETVNNLRLSLLCSYRIEIMLPIIFSFSSTYHIFMKHEKLKKKFNIVFLNKDKP